jgi:DNA repair exonuclease SbcCD ATPase subunit
MHIHEIRIEGVGPFVDNAFEFDARGLNVVLGNNESGKSTLCRVLSAVLYGFPDRATAEASRSWLPSDKYVGQVDITGRSGRFRIHRDFATDRVQVVKILPGREKEVFKGDGNPRGRTEPALAYKKLLNDEIGLPSESIFNSSARVGQLQLEIEIDEDLRKQLSGAGQSDYKRARESLRDQYYDLTTQPLQGDAAKRRERRVESTRSAISRLSTALTNAGSDRATMASLFDQRSALQAEMHAFQQDYERVQARHRALQSYDLLAKRLRDMNNQEALASANDKELEKQDAQIAAIDRELADERFAALRGLTTEELEQLRRYLQSDADAALAKIEQLRRREGDLQTELGTRYLALRDAPPDTGQHLESMNAHQEAVSRLERELGSTQPATQQTRRSMRLPLVLLAAGFAAGALIGALAGLALGRLIAMVIGILVGGLLVGLLGGGIGLIITLARSTGPSDTQAEQAAKQARLAEERSALADTQARLASVLAASEPHVTGAVLLERWRRVQVIRTELQTLATQRAAQESLSVLPLRDDPKIGPIIKSQSAAVLRDRLEKYDQLCTRLAEHNHTRSSLQTVAGSAESDSQALASERSQTLSDILHWEEHYPTFKLLRDDEKERLNRIEQDSLALSHMDANQKACRDKIQQLEFNIARLQGSLELDPVALQEEIDQRHDELDHMLARCGSLKTAVEVLEQAIADYEEDHLSRLSQKTAGYFGKFTAGRYCEVQILPDRPIMVTPVDGGVFPSTSLSTGARDQLYFAMRLAVSDLLAGEVELPLILDDTFVNFDRTRLAVAEKMLKEIAATRQIVLLSHDIAYRGWADRVIELGVVETEIAPEVA